MRTTMRKKIAIILAVAGTMLLLSSGIAFAAKVINCEPGKACNGTAQSDKMQGSRASDEMNGRAGRDLMSGEYGKDVMHGALSKDTIRGGYNGDRLFGEDGNDVIRGQNGKDFIDGGPGNDNIGAGGGDDTIRADDGQLDSISCGLGTDVVFVDLEDLDAENTNFEDFIRLTSCETINEPEAPQTPE